MQTIINRKYETHVEFETSNARIPQLQKGRVQGILACANWSNSSSVKIIVLCANPHSLTTRNKYIKSQNNLT